MVRVLVVSQSIKRNASLYLPRTQTPREICPPLTSKANQKKHSWPRLAVPPSPFFRRLANEGLGYENAGDVIPP